jgi:hypothetical protein
MAKKALLVEELTTTRPTKTPKVWYQKFGPEVEKEVLAITEAWKQGKIAWDGRATYQFFLKHYPEVKVGESTFRRTLGDRP